MSGVGAALSQLVVPGLGPAIVGALAGAAVSETSRPPQRKPRVFVSFDFDNDQGLKHLLVGQARNSRTPFELSDHSLREAAPNRKWKAQARQKIRRCDLVVVLLGAHTHAAPGVLAEIEMAREEGKPVVQMISARGRAHKRIQGAGRVISWSWTRLESVLSSTS